MRVLLDENLPIGLCAELSGHTVDTVAGGGWAGIKNGELRRLMAGEYDALVTMDRGIVSQNRTTNLPFGIILVRAPPNRLRHLRPLIRGILSAIAGSTPGQIRRVGR